MKLWQGRFKADFDTVAEEFNDSLPFDKAMYAQDIEGSIAHCKMLCKCGIIADSDCRAVVDGLKQICKDIESGKLAIEGAEDIHSFVENELTARVGDPGRRLHTARSRNDQVATDFRLYVRDAIDGICELLRELIATFADRAAKEKHTPMPAYTHMQKAQPTTLAHYLMAYAQMFLRDLQRFCDCRRRVNVMPLGNGACVATTYPIDREYTAKLLGFDGVTQNSQDGVSDRDFAVEFLFACSLTAIHLSRINEEFVYWAGEEFGFIALPDEFSTGSSIMPQKKNPDVNELLRGKCGRIIGELMGLLTVMKGLPLAYNKDMQEDKEAVFDAEKTIVLSLRVFTRMLSVVEFNRDAMRIAAPRGFSCATECADYLVKKGVPFRSAHEAVGKLVVYCTENDKTLQDLTLAEFRKFSPQFDADIVNAVDLNNAIQNRTVIGGCAPNEIDRQIKVVNAELASLLSKTKN